MLLATKTQVLCGSLENRGLLVKLHSISMPCIFVTQTGRRNNLKWNRLFVKKKKKVPNSLCSYSYYFCKENNMHTYLFKSSAQINKMERNCVFFFNARESKERI